MSARTRPAVVAATVVLALAAVTAAVLLAGRDSERPPGHSADAAPGMAHVHGLGLDDGELLAGTHVGTFRVGEDGTATQVGPTQDYMGFTVVGPGHYLASGHPAPGRTHRGTSA